MAQNSGELDDSLARLKTGDKEALAVLFSRCRQRLARTVLFRLDRRLLGRVDPDDIMQEAYLNAAARIDHFRGDTFTSFYVWLRMIVSQTLVDVHRLHLGAQMRAAGREVSVDRPQSARSTSASIAVHLLGRLTSPSRAAVRRETARQLEEALQSMDPIDREVLALRHFEELSNSEVAEVLDLQQKAASIRYVRALRRLKAILSRVPGLTDYRQEGKR